MQWTKNRGGERTERQRNKEAAKSEDVFVSVCVCVSVTCDYAITEKAKERKGEFFEGAVISLFFSKRLLFSLSLAFSHLSLPPSLSLVCPPMQDGETYGIFLIDEIVFDWREV